MESDRSFKNKVWSLPVSEPDKGLNVQITGVDSLFVFAASKNGAQSKSGETVDGHYVRKSLWIWGTHQRTLANEAVGTFLSIQKSMHESNGDKSLILLVKKSREYRSMIQACIAEMNQVIERSVTSKDDLEELKANCELLYKMELVLGLVEIVFIDNQSGCSILNQLLGWIRLHFPQCTMRLSECLSWDEPHLHQNYWDTVYGLVLQGMMEDARKLLATHPDNTTDPFLSIEELLKKMPIYVVYSGISVAEFIVRWQHWQSECESRLHNKEFASCKNLETLCKILCGDLDTLVSLVDVLDTWYHLMVSYLLFTNPTVKLYRFSSAAQEAIGAFGVESQISELDHLLLAVLEADGQQVIKQSQRVLDNVWFAVHVSDLLHHTMENDSPFKKSLSEVRDTLLLDYSSELVSHSSLWQVGLVYLDYCGDSTAAPIVEAVLEKMPLSDNTKALKVLQAATDRGMDSVARGICRVMGRRGLACGQLGSAIWWGVRSRDAYFTSHLAHKILHKYMVDGQFDSSSLLDHLGPDMLLSETLTFLSKYREFHILYQESKYKAAASLLVSLVASKMAPEYFWPVLLEDALPLLDLEKAVFSTDQTYNLMYCLHKISQNVEQNAFKDKNATSFSERENEVRLALTNNLARAIIQEGTLTN